MDRKFLEPLDLVPEQSGAVLSTREGLLVEVSGIGDATRAAAIAAFANDALRTMDAHPSDEWRLIVHQGDQVLYGRNAGSLRIAIFSKYPVNIGELDIAADEIAHNCSGLEHTSASV